MLLQRANTSKAEKVTDRTFRFIISDETKDRYGTVIKLSGWQLENYAKNGIVAFQHNTWSDNPDMILGKGKAWIEGNTLMGEVEFPEIGKNPVADKVVDMLNFGSLNATSVGFNPLEWTWGDKSRGEDPNTLYFTKSDLLEWSIVTIPANPNATKEDDFEGFVKMAFDDKPKLPKQEETPAPQADQYTGRMLRLRMQSL